MERPTPHPSDRALKSFGLGKLDDAAAQAVLSHLSSCPGCREKVTAQSGDSFVERLRGARGSSGTPAPAKSLESLPEESRVVEPVPEAAAGLPEELATNPNYQVLRELGRGGMGVVYLARDVVMDRMVVLKVMVGAYLDRPETRERFVGEIRSAAKLDHPNVVKAYTVVQTGKLLGFVMEYVDGEDLHRLVKAKGPLPVTNACYYVYQAASGLQHAHEKGMVHRDIKPHNLMLARGKKHQVKILDFGLAKATSEKPDEHGLTGTGQMLGTPDYVAPEQTLDAATATTRADIYSLGCTLYYLLTGKPPFKGRTAFEVMQAHHTDEARPLEEVRPDAPLGLGDVVRRMMAKSPDDRYQTPGEVARALQPFVKRGTSTAGSLHTPKPASEPILKSETMQAADTSRMRVLAAVVTQPPAAAPTSPFSDLVESAGPVPPRARTSPASARRIPFLPITIAAAVLLLALLAGGAVVVRVRTGKGTFVITSQRPGVEIVVSRDGKTVQIIDVDTKQTIELPSGPYEVALAKPQKGLSLSTDRFTITRGGEALVEVRWEPALAPAKDATAKATTATEPASTFEALRRDSIPPDELAAAGGGDPKNAPPGLVAILGDGRLKHWAPIDAVSFSPDGKTIVSTGWEGASLWNARDGRALPIPGQNDDVALSAIYSPDGRTLAIGCRDGSIRLCDVGSNTTRKILEKQRGQIHRLAFSPEGTFLAAAAINPTVAYVWRVSTGQLERTFDAPMLILNRLAFSPDGKVLAAGGGAWWDAQEKKASVKLWNLAKDYAEVSLSGLEGYVVSLAFAPDGKSLAVICNTQTNASLWDVATGQRIRELRPANDRVVSLVFTRDGKELLTGRSGKLWFWDPGTGTCNREAPGPWNADSDMALAPDGRTLAAGGWSRAVWLWDIATASEKPASAGRPRGINHLSISPDGRTVASGGQEGPVRLWDVSTNRLKRLLEGHHYWTAGSAFSPDGRTLATGGEDCTIRLWNLNGEDCRQLRGVDSNVRALTFSRDGHVLASGSHDGVVRVWSVNSEDRWLNLTGHTSPVRCVAFSPDGKLLASGADGSFVKLWDLSKGICRANLQGHRGAVRSLVFAADGATLISASDDRTIRWWDVSSNSERLKVDRSSGAPISLALSPDGKTLAAAGNDGLVLLHDAANGRPLETIRIARLRAEVDQVVFAPDGRHLVTGNGNGTIYVLRPQSLSTSGATPAPASPTPTQTTGTPPDNKAKNDAGRDKGFESLFNGKDLTGWTPDGGSAAWSVKDGAIAANAGHPDGAEWMAQTYLLSAREYNEFTLRFEFKRANETARSGVALRALPKDPDADPDFPYQLTVMLGNYEDYAPGARTGALWWSQNNAIQPARLQLRQPELKPGQWIKAEVDLHDQTLRFSVSGVEVQNTRLDQAAETLRNPAPGLRRNAGRIGFLSRADEVLFRNIEIQPAGKQ
jgi:WD40 repeat protein/serine/threonine protein kinase